MAAGAPPPSPGPQAGIFNSTSHGRGKLLALDSEHLAAEFFTLYSLLLLVSLIAAYQLKSRRCCKFVSEAGITLFIGFLGGGLLQLFVYTDEQDQYGELELRNKLVGFSSNILLCLLLPPIVFDSGYRMRGPFFWANIDKIMTLAFAGTLFSSLWVGALVYLMQGTFFTESLSLAEALTFGALISATDPVTTLAIFEQTGVDPHLFNIVFGESVLNDAVGIVLFHTFAKLIDFSGGVGAILLHACTQFFLLFVCSAMLGFGAGCLFAFGLKHARLHVHTERHGPQLELAIFLVACYFPYLIAECISLSGIVAILFAGTSMKRYASKNLSESALAAAETTLTLLAHIAETLIFVDLGTSAWHTFRASLGLVIWAIAACLLARAAHVYPIGWILRALPVQYPRRKFEWSEMHMVWFSGLRGAIAYALSTQFPGRHGKSVMSLTMAIVLASVWMRGGATELMLRFFGTRQLGPEEMKQQALTLEPAVNRLFLVHWDRKYIRPLLSRDASGGSTHEPISSELESTSARVVWPPAHWRERSNGGKNNVAGGVGVSTPSGQHGELTRAPSLPLLGSACQEDADEERE
jgi:sodium/hydrogen exchanger 8